MTKRMPARPPKGLYGKAIAAWVRGKNRELLAANQLRRAKRKAR